GDIGRLSIGGAGGGARGAGPGRAGGGPGVAPTTASFGGPGGPPAPGAAAGAGGAGAPRAGGAGPGAGAPGARGARAGGGAPAQQPVVLSRNGRQFELTASTVRAGTEIKVATERPTVSLTLTELDPGSWVVFELPGFTTAAAGAQQDSLDALRKASAT